VIQAMRIQVRLQAALCITLLLCHSASVAACSDVTLLNEDEIHKFLKDNNYDPLTSAISKLSKTKDAITEEEFAYVLRVCRISISHRADLTRQDYDLMLSGADFLCGKGDAGLKYQSVLINELAQDSLLFDTMTPDDQKGYRTRCGELFVGIYERAFSRLRQNFDFNKASERPEIPPLLLERMTIADIDFDLRGDPHGANFKGAIKNDYDALIQAHNVYLIEADIQRQARRILDPDNIVLIKRFFTERYRRAPVNYKEAHDFLSRIKGVAFNEKEIFCSIETDTQVKIPEMYHINCGSSFGAEKDF
jgi:hypothetical protein